MRKDLKEILKNNRLSFGSWITLGHNSIPEIMAKAGFDWLVIDMEHSAIGIQRAQDLIQIIELKNMAPLVRLTENDSGLIKRVMDAGAYGIIIPMVKTKKDAIKAVKSVKYPPLGSRSVGLARAQGYGQDFEEYKTQVNKNSIIIVQIEHIDAVNNIDEIFSVEEIDGYIIGPYDLSASLGIPGELNDKKVLDAEKKVLKASRKYGKTAGIHVVPTDPKIALEKINNNYKFIALSLDFLFLGNSCIKMVENIKEKI